TSNSDSKREKPVVAVDARRPWYWPFGKTPPPTRDEPPLLDKPALVVAKKPAIGPILIPDDPEPKPMPKPEIVKVQVPPTPAKAPILAAADLQKRIKEACPAVKNVDVEFTSNT